MTDRAIEKKWRSEATHTLHLDVLNDNQKGGWALEGDVKHSIPDCPGNVFFLGARKGRVYIKVMPLDARVQFTIATEFMDCPECPPTLNTVALNADDSEDIL